MNKTLNKIKDWALVWIWILLVFWIANAWVNISSVTNWEALTSTIWNELVSKINDIWTRTDWIYNNWGNIWIGVPTPNKKLEVNWIVDAQNTIKAYASFNWLWWVNIYDSYGISSIVRNSAWIYTITWSTPFANDFYVITWACNMWWSWWAKFWLSWNNINWHSTEWITNTTAQISCRDSLNANTDTDLIHILAIWQQ